MPQDNMIILEEFKEIKKLTSGLQSQIEDLQYINARFEKNLLEIMNDLTSTMPKKALTMEDLAD